MGWGENGKTPSLVGRKGRAERTSVASPGQCWSVRAQESAGALQTDTRLDGKADEQPVRMHTTSGRMTSAEASKPLPSSDGLVFITLLPGVTGLALQLAESTRLSQSNPEAFHLGAEARVCQGLSVASSLHSLQVKRCLPQGASQPPQSPGQTPAFLPPVSSAFSCTARDS